MNALIVVYHPDKMQQGPCRDFHFPPYENDMLKKIIHKRLTQVVAEATISHAIFRACLTLTHYGDTRQALSCILIKPTCCLSMLTLHSDSASHVHCYKFKVFLCRWQTLLLQLATFSIADEGSQQVQCEEYP